MIKVIGGVYKGRKLKSSIEGVRPTTAFVKKRYFDIIGPRIRGAYFMDAFAGSGGVGIEALSRGAEFVVFIENSRKVTKVILHNLKKIGVPEDMYKIVEMDYTRGVSECSKMGLKFDFIFIDPPFSYYETNNPLRVLWRRDVLKDDGLIALERPKEKVFKHKYFTLVREFKTSSSIVSFFKKGVEKVE